MTLSPPEVRELLHRYRIVPSRASGQNFVADPNTVRRIVRIASVQPGDAVLEIGAGLGSLTTALLDAGAEVTAIERDPRLVAALREVLGARGARVVESDARAVAWEELLADVPRWALVANLPYNLATPLVLDLLEHVPAVDRMLVMVQAEVGDRLAAAPGARAYGLPSLRVAYHGAAEIVGRVPPTVFIPQPRVDSALVSLRRRPAPPTDADPAVLFDLARRAFTQRRKMLRRSLGAVVPPEVFARAGIEGTARPESLSVVDWGRLADALAARGS